MSKSRLLACSCVLGVLAVAVYFAWRTRALSSASAKQGAQIKALNAELAAAQQLLIEQRELLRHDRLRNTARTPDEFLALFPARFPQGNWQPAEGQFEDCWFRSADGLRLHGWLLRHPKPVAAVLFIHGNAGNLTHRAQRAAYLSERSRISIFVFDYRGYGRSEGTPTMEGLLADARAARALIAEREGIMENKVVLLGESLGGAVAVDLASRDSARGLILESTFSSLREVASAHYPPLLVDTLIADRLNSVAAIAGYRGPLLQVHGDADRTIPLQLGKRLHDAGNSPKRLIVLAGHDHNDALPREYDDALAEFFSELGQP